ncbi:AraC family transcriptional regulator [Dictyobacter kobayashii]|nr:AraC family transcriptional regulator [Dictyobacter kobayashii]
MIDGESEMWVGYVAHETGFADQSHFTRQFKR